MSSRLCYILLYQYVWEASLLRPHICRKKYILNVMSGMSTAEEKGGHYILTEALHTVDIFAYIFAYSAHKTTIICRY